MRQPDGRTSNPRSVANLVGLKRKNPARLTPGGVLSLFASAPPSREASLTRKADSVICIGIYNAFSRFTSVNSKNLHKICRFQARDALRQ